MELTTRRVLSFMKSLPGTKRPRARPSSNGTSNHAVCPPLDRSVYHSRGQVYYQVSFRAVVFCPFQTELLVGTVRQMTERGLHVSLGFFDDIFVPPELLQQPAIWNNGEWCWKMDEESDRSTMLVSLQTHTMLHGMDTNKPTRQMFLRVTSSQVCFGIECQSESSMLRVSHHAPLRYDNQLTYPLDIETLGGQRPSTVDIERILIQNS